MARVGRERQGGLERVMFVNMALQLAENDWVADDGGSRRSVDGPLKSNLASWEVILGMLPSSSQDVMVVVESEGFARLQRVKG